MIETIKAVQAALSAGNQVRVHGNGFLQLDLNSSTRLHVWGDPRIPKQKVDTPIHDHVFDFSSTVVKGVLMNIVYDICDGASYRFYGAKIRQGQDTVLTHSENTCDVKIKSSDIIPAGTTYEMKHGIFHESLAHSSQITVSVMTKTPAIITDRSALVLVPVDKEPDNQFNRHGFNQHFLLEILSDSLKP